MTPTQIQISKMSDKDLIWRKKVVDSHVERLIKQQKWLAEELDFTKLESWLSASDRDKQLGGLL
jgi:hypothetical protein|nr:MAG TPA: hypothetical protein [Caudoviricetes sp.]